MAEKISLVLATDDERFIEQHGARLAQEFEVSIIRSAQACRTEVLLAPPQVLILDTRISDGSGYELHQSLRQAEATEDMYQLLLCGEWDVEQDGFAADDFLLRPVAEAAFWRKLGMLQKNLERLSKKSIKPHGTEVFTPLSSMGELGAIFQALGGQGFALYQQAIVPTKPDLAQGCELLIRLRGENGNLMLPAMFLPAVDLYGITPRLDRWLTSRICELLGQGRFPYAFASINLSALTMADSGFVSFLKDELGRTGAQAESLVFEVAESAVLSGQTAARHFMAALRALGCRVAMDNFGAGVNACSQLSDLPVDVLKLDGRFSRGLPHDELNCAIVRAARDIASAARLKLSAQYVESEEQRAFLADLGVDWLQGYAIAYPAPLIAR